MTSENLALRIEKERQEVEDRASRLHRVSLEAIDELEDMVSYVPAYFREKWGYDETIARLKADASAAASSSGVLS